MRSTPELHEVKAPGAQNVITVVGANGSTALYAWINLSDLSLAIMSAFNAVCCAIVLLLAAYKRLLLQQRLWTPRDEAVPHAGIHV